MSDDDGSGRPEPRIRSSSAIGRGDDIATEDSSVNRAHFVVDTDYLGRVESSRQDTIRPSALCRQTPSHADPAERVTSDGRGSGY